MQDSTYVSLLGNEVSVFSILQTAPNVNCDCAPFVLSAFWKSLEICTILNLYSSQNIINRHRQAWTMRRSG